MGGEGMKPGSLICLIGLIGLVSCRQEGSKPVTETSSRGLIPFAVGKKWSYVSTSFDSLGREVSSHEDGTTVTGDTVVAGEKWYALTDDSAGHRFGDAFYATNRQDGVYMLGSRGTATLLFRFPAALGDTSPPYIVRSVDTAVSCPAGIFRCYLYRDTVAVSADHGRIWAIVTNDYFAPGVGMVRHELKTQWRDTLTGRAWAGPGEIRVASGF